MFFFTLCVMSSCEGEKDLIVSDVKSPIHTKELYLVDRKSTRLNSSH